jgi:hypothetical protein
VPVKEASMKLPATWVEAEKAAILQHARAALHAARGAFTDGDPFSRTTMHAHVRRMLKSLAELHERNCAYLLRLALAGAEDAHEVLADLIAERTLRVEPLGPALTTYVNLLGERGRPHIRQPQRTFWPISSSSAW